jgi:hypothetical protein
VTLVISMSYFGLVASAYYTLVHHHARWHSLRLEVRVPGDSVVLAHRHALASFFHKDACALPDCIARFPTACVAPCFSLLCDSRQPGATAYVEFKEPHKCQKVQIWDSVSAHM